MWGRVSRATRPSWDACNLNVTIRFPRSAGSWEILGLMKRHVPNALTCCNLLCGCVAALCALRGAFPAALLWMVGGAVFDFFDGFAARLLGVSSPLGKELDSLADDVTFGFVPAAVLFAMLGQTELARLAPWAPYVAFLIAAFSALRLAKFNLDARQTLGFLGLPTPAHALFWASLAAWLPQEAYAEAWTPWVLLALEAAGCWLLVSEVPMFALKFKHFGWRGNEVRYVFVLLAAVLLCGLGWGGFAVIIPLYVATSVVVSRRR